MDWRKCITVLITKLSVADNLANSLITNMHTKPTDTLMTNLREFEFVKICHTKTTTRQTKLPNMQHAKRSMGLVMRKPDCVACEQHRYELSLSFAHRNI